MKTMKYRVWCLDRKDYEKEKTYITPEGRLFRKYVLDGKWRDDTETHVVEFSTGIYDKNGKEAYYGDIVSIPTYLIDGDIPTKAHLAVLDDSDFEPGAVGLSGNPIEWTSLFDLTQIEFEIVGNIHEKEMK
jgi:hypothetical protein